MENAQQMKQEAIVNTAAKRVKPKWNLMRNWPLHLMVIPALLVVIVFQYGPLPGLIMAFQQFKPWLGFIDSPFVGLEQFNKMWEFSQSRQVILNTLIIASLKVAFQLIVPFIFALLLNEIRMIRYKRTIQTLVYLPHFLSWVILGGILIDMLSTDGGMVNRILGSMFGIKPIFFLGDGDWFRFTVIVSDVWKDFGFATIIFLAALAGIDPSLYEAAVMDGCNRFKQVLYITIPGLIPISIVVGTLSLGSILNAGFDQIFNLYNPLVFAKGDIIDTYVYRVGLLSGDYSFGTAVGMFKSIVSFILIMIAYRMAYVFANYRIF
ncbi:putative aldouronate transport system permease protein [Paenibacillus sp. 1_12]|uniref:ABC transporter permease n=1 Tax=Paenibacillus sp. 1_12 TaxID=1566278 RepID=UPI0008E46D7B|nr:ABC transporter permease subunit [Paenibacillus sp. 1_12]SFK95675.1 putative aldouronate transport system permease protein [Paenibacillus sp. 1_12]